MSSERGGAFPLSTCALLWLFRSWGTIVLPRAHTSPPPPGLPNGVPVSGRPAFPSANDGVSYESRAACTRYADPFFFLFPT